MEIIGIVIFFGGIAWLVARTTKKISQNEQAAKLGLTLWDRWRNK